MTNHVKNVMKGASGLGTVRTRLSCLDAVRSESSLSLNGTLGCAGKKTTMKKLMIAASAALFAAVGFGDGITSANVVGYATKTCPANRFQQTAAQFEDVKSGKLSLDTVFSGLPGVSFDEGDVFMGTAPHIQVVKDDGIPNKYYYLLDGYYENEAGEESYKPGWCDSFGNLVNLEATQGVGFWLKNGSSNEETLLGTGSVFPKATAQVVAPANIFSINANVYPIAINLNDETQVTFPDIVGVNFDEADLFMGTAPHIQVVKAEGTREKYDYLKDGYGEFDGKETYKPGWCDSFGNLVDVKIAAQSGFWVKATSGAFTFNYKR